MTYNEALESLNVENGAYHPSLDGALVKTNDIFRFGMANKIGIPYDDDLNEREGEAIILVRVVKSVFFTRVAVDETPSNPEGIDPLCIECDFDFILTDEMLESNEWNLAPLSSTIKNN